jgi:hypothetical protein
MVLTFHFIVADTEMMYCLVLQPIKLPLLLHHQSQCVDSPTAAKKTYLLYVHRQTCMAFRLRLLFCEKEQVLSFSKQKLFIMKKNVNKYRLFIAAAMVVSSFTFAPAAQAENFTGTNPVELKLVSQEKESRIFELVIGNTETAAYKIVIRDESYTILYADKLKGKNLCRKFELKNEDPLNNGETLTFEVTNLTTGKSVVYKINTITRVERKTEISIAK